MSKQPTRLARIEAHGFHFYRDGEKWLSKGVTYGPFRPDRDGNAYPPVEQIIIDFDMMAQMGANTVRVYTPPTEELARLAAERGLYLLVDVPWPKHLDVYGIPELEQLCLDMVTDGIEATASMPNMLGVMIGNEIPADLARWATPKRVEKFLRRLYDHAKELHPEGLVGFANFPSTEFLQLGFFDFIGFNVYLESERDLRRYLYRLRYLYPETPLLLSETGLDSLSNGEEEQARVLEFSLRTAFEAGMAGTLVFSWTDEWHTGGYDIEDWHFGLLDHERRPKAAYEVARQCFQTAPHGTELTDTPRVSVVVASYNGGETLADCLHSLERLNYPDYEVIVVDDGSTDNTAEILRDFPRVIVHSQENKGLSAARNAGIALASGEIVAFTDSDCVADPDWLHFLVLAMTRTDCAGAGGPNLTPWESRPLHRTVAYAPGHATHVLLGLEEAEHVPGCNMAFWRSELVEAGCFDPVFRKAGDDVDMIWRLQDCGERVMFAPGAFVWHHRRATLQAYLKQQMGYGEAEALLVRKHPHRFNDRGQSLWRGVIYSGPELQPLVRSHDVHFGVFGSAGFQCIYERRAGFLTHFVTSFEWWMVCVALMLAGLVSQAALLAGIGAVGITMTVSGVRAWRNFRLSRDLASRHFPVVWLLWVLQPVVRGWKRYSGAFARHSASPAFRRDVDAGTRGRRIPYRTSMTLEYWGEKVPDRLTCLRRLSDMMTRQGWLHAPNTGWEPWDLSVVLSQWFRSRLISAEEDHGENRRLLRMRLSLIPTSLFGIFVGAGIVACGLMAFQDSVLARVVLIALIVVWWVILRGAMRAQSAIASALDRLVCESGYQIIRRKEQIENAIESIAESAEATARSIHVGKG